MCNELNVVWSINIVQEHCHLPTRFSAPWRHISPVKLTDIPVPQLVVDYVSKQRVFVTSFWARPWKLTDKSLRTRAKRFIRRLRRDGHSFLDSYFYLAKYDR